MNIDCDRCNRPMAAEAVTRVTIYKPSSRRLRTLAICPTCEHEHAAWFVEGGLGAVLAFARRVRNHRRHLAEQVQEGGHLAVLAALVLAVVVALGSGVVSVICAAPRHLPVSATLPVTGNLASAPASNVAPIVNTPTTEVTPSPSPEPSSSPPPSPLSSVAPSSPSPSPSPAPSPAPSTASASASTPVTPGPTAQPGPQPVTPGHTADVTVCVVSDPALNAQYPVVFGGSCAEAKALAATLPGSTVSQQTYPVTGP